MSIHRRAAKRDSAEQPIVDALRSVGALVAQVSGTGVPDLIVSRLNVVYLLEVKTGKRGKLTPEQVKFHEQWGDVVSVVRTVDEALRAIKAIS